MKRQLLTIALLILAVTKLSYGQNYNFSAVSSSGHTLYYSINSNNTTVTVVPPSEWGWDWEDSPYGELTIPSSVYYNGEYYSVTAIGTNAFQFCELTSVSIPTSVTTIGAYAFYDCTDLNSITIPNSVNHIGECAFGGIFNVVYHGTATGSPWCARNVNAYFEDGFIFTDSTKTIVTGYEGDSTEIVIPNTVTTIAQEAFSGLYITSATIPITVTSIGDYAFSGCSSLSTINIQNAAASIGEYAFAGCSGLVSLSLGDSITEIGESAFQNCTSLTSVVIPNSVTYIGSSAFYNIRLLIYSGTATGSPWGAYRCISGYVDSDFVYTDSTKTVLKAYIGYSTSVTIPNTVTTIGDSAFYNCTNIISIVIPDSVTTIGNSAFNYCRRLASVTIPETVNTIGEYAFFYCISLTSVEIPHAVSFIGRGAFGACYSITSIFIPDSVLFIGENAFSNVNLIIYLGQAIGGPWGANRALLYSEGDFIYSDSTKTELGKYTGHSANVIIPNSVTTIWQRAFFENDSLRTIIISDSVTTIEEYAFYNCQNLAKVTFGSSISNIDSYAFANCSQIDSLIFLCQTPPSGSSLAFYNISSNITVIVPCHTWIYYNSYYANSFEGNTTIEETDGCVEYDFWAVSPSNDTLYYRIMDSSSVRIVHPRSDLRWNGISWPVGQLIIPTTVVYENNEYRVGSIAEGVFMYDTAITSLTLPYTIDSIGSAAFAFCTQIDTLIYDIDSCIGLNPYTEGNFNSQVFYGDNNISTIILGNHVKVIPEASFHYYTNNLSSLHLGDSVTRIGNYAFYGLTNIDTLIIPNSVTSIGSQAFMGSEQSVYGGATSRLKTLIIGASVDSIGELAFALHTELDSISVVTENTTFDSRNHCNAIIRTSTNTLVLGCQSTVIPGTVTAIGEGGFAATRHLKTITLPDSLQSIGNRAFILCDSLTSISFPSTLSSIGELAFNGCYNIDSITLASSVPPVLGYGTFSGISYNISVTVPCNTLTAYTESPWNEYFSNFIEPTVCPLITYYDFWNISPSNDTLYYKIIDSTRVACVHPLMHISHNSFWTGYTQPSGSLIIPSTVSEEGVTYRVVSIRDNTFADNTAITSVTLPPSIDSLGNYAFANCTNLDTLHYNIDSCSYWADQRQNHISYYGRDFYYYDYFDTRVFDNDDISTLYIGRNVRWLPGQPFHAGGFYNLETLFFNADSIISDDNNYRQYFLELPPRSGLFENLPISSLHIGDHVKYLSCRAFAGCVDFDSIVLSCTTPPQIIGDAGSDYTISTFYGVPTNIPVYVPCQSSSTYLASDWNRFSNIIGHGLNSLSPVSGLLPAQNSIITHGSIVLQWDSVEGAIEYDIYLWRTGDTMPTSPTYTTHETYQNITDYDNQQSYNWKVLAYDLCDTSESTIQHFFIHKQPFLTANNDTMHFGMVTLNDTKSQTFSINCRDLTDSIHLSICGPDSAMFTLSSNAISRFGGFVRVSFSPTVIQPSFNAYINITSGAAFDTVFLSAELAHYYLFSVSVPDSVLPPNTPVVINGTLENAAHQAQANVPVDIHLTIMSKNIVFTDTTDALGHFGAIYTPQFSECGYYEIGACLHGEECRTTLTSFNIPGISLSNKMPVWETTQYDTLVGSIAIRNRCNMTLHNISISIDTMPAGVSIHFDTMNLGAFQDDSLHFILVGNTLSSGDYYENIQLSVHCSEGYLSRMNPYYYCFKPIPDLEISFDSIVCAVVPGVQKVVDMALYNHTDSTFTNIQVILPSVQSNIQLLGVDSTINIAPHDTVFVPLLIMFPENTPLVPVFGEIWVTADNTQSQQVPFTLNLVSESTGRLRILVSNEYTYYDGSHVSNAEIAVVGYYSLDTVAYGVTDTSGLMQFDSIPEGYYKLYVSAPENSPYAKTIQIHAGEQTFVDADLNFEAVTYEWHVTQEDSADHWSLSLHTEFKSSVPKPVITIETTSINVPPDGSFGSFDMTISNHGLIDTWDATILMPSSPIYEYIALYDWIDTIHALSSVTIPCSVRNKLIYDSIQKIISQGNYYIDTLYSVSPRKEVLVHYIDTIVYIPTFLYGYDTNGVELWKYDTAIVSIPHYVVDTVYDTTINNVIYYDSITNEVLINLTINEPLSNNKAVENQLDNSKEIKINDPTLNECYVENPVMVVSHYSCNSITGKTFVGYEYIHIPPIVYMDCINEYLEYFIGKVASNMSLFHLPPDAIDAIENKTLYQYQPKFVIKDQTCESCWYKVAKYHTLCEFLPKDLCILDWANSEYDCYIIEQRGNDIIKEHIKAHTNRNSNRMGITDVNVFARNVRIIKQYYDYQIADWKRIVNDSLPVFDSVPEVLEQIVDYLQTTNVATVEGLANCYDTTITTIDTNTLRRYAERWNRSLIYSRYGWTDPSMVLEGFSRDYYYPDTNIMAAMTAKIDTAIALGYESIEDMYDKTIEAMLNSPAKHSQCASVSLQFNQDFAMTREAFTGILSIKNPHSTQPLRNLNALFTVTDTLGHDCSDKFDISITKWEGIDTSTGNIAADSKGNITVRFVPLMSAAPTDTVSYLFGGTIEYINPYTNDTTSDYLEPVRLPVSPSPHLQLDYFIPHDIIADDPLTSPIIEASIPATIGLRVLNDGMGVAKNVRVSTLQPQIVENRLGLAIEFHMSGTKRNGMEQSQPLSDISLGNLLPEETQTMEYYLMSSLLGSMTIKEVNVIHKSSVDDKDMSLVDARAHRLAKPILQYGITCDSIHDFLTDDIPNGYNIPDSLFFSNGLATSVHEATTTLFDHYVEPDDTVVLVTIYPDTIGWNYGETDDPGRGKYEIISCVRDDNTTIPLDNIWLTFVDLPEDQDPVYVNKLHIADTLSAIRATTYNVTFRLKPNLLNVDTITFLPLSNAEAPLDSFMVVFNQPVIDSTFSFADMSLKCNNGEELMDSTISIHRIGYNSFSIDVSQKTLTTGLYVLKVMADSIVDANGQYGYGGKEIHWVRTTCNPYVENVSITACESYQWRNHLLAVTGVYCDTVITPNRCDSIFTLSLTINNNTSSTETVTACDSYTWHGTAYTASTDTPTHSTTNAAGCDSTITLHLTINNNSTGLETVTACDSYIWHGTAYTASTDTPTYSTTNAAGCDSTVTLHLTINNSSTSLETVTACDTYTWHGTAYTTSTNTPTYVSTNTAGCDSTITLNLTINNSTTSTETVTACDSYTWWNTNYTNSTNSATHVLSNATGCDSTITLHLTINNSTASTETVTACDTYTWHGTDYTASTNTPTYTTTNALGCDSTVTLHLTINYSTTATDTITACDSYTWHDSTYSAPTLNSQFSTLNSVGCDSTVTLHLTLNYSTTSVESITACDSIEWHGTVYTENTNTPTFVTTNADGCDSTITLDLTLNHSVHITIVDTAANHYEWNDEVYTESGEYVFEGQTREGCDSIVTLLLTINQVGIANGAELDGIDIYPNPTTGKLTISADGVLKVEVYDHSGRLVGTYANTNQLDISKLPASTYALRISLQKGNTVRRVIKR